MSILPDPLVSIVIPTKNAEAHLKDVLCGIFSQEVSFVYEVLVIDSGSSDRTISLVQRYPDIRLFHIAPQDFNHGLTRNFGITQSRGPYVVLMTQDAVPASRHWLAALIKNFTDDQGIAGVYARQIPRAEADVLIKRHLNSWITARTDRATMRLSDAAMFNQLHPMERYTLCYFDDVCSCLRKSVWQEIGFEKTYFGEDVAWGKKVILSGRTIMFEPEAAVIHSHNRSISYEFSRTYACHRRLHELFGLQTVPTRKLLWLFVAKNILNDVPYVLRHEKAVLPKLKLLWKIPFLSFASVYAQYRGAKDEKEKRPYTVKHKV